MISSCRHNVVFLQIEQYWNGMKDIRTDCLDDQGKLNYGLRALDITWYDNDNHDNITVRGRANNGLQVNILPYDDVCRLDECKVSKRSSYFIWHKGGLRSRKKKLDAARDGKTWFLKYKWDKIYNNYIGKDWLKSIAYLGVTMS